MKRTTRNFCGKAKSSDFYFVFCRPLNALLRRPSYSYQDWEYVPLHEISLLDLDSIPIMKTVPRLVHSQCEGPFWDEFQKVLAKTAYERVLNKAPEGSDEQKELLKWNHLFR